MEVQFLSDFYKPAIKKKKEKKKSVTIFHSSFKDEFQQVT